MQWNGDRYAGFSDAEPWLPVGDDRAVANVAAQRDDADSLLNFYRRLIALRREQPVLVNGCYRNALRQPPLLTFRRSDDNATLFVALNLGADPQPCDIDGRGRVLVSTHADAVQNVDGQVELRGNEGLVILLQ